MEGMHYSVFGKLGIGFHRFMSFSERYSDS